MMNSAERNCVRSHEWIRLCRHVSRSINTFHRLAIGDTTPSGANAVCRRARLTVRPRQKPDTLHAPLALLRRRQSHLTAAAAPAAADAIRPTRHGARLSRASSAPPPRSVRQNTLSLTRSPNGILAAEAYANRAVGSTWQWPSSAPLTGTSRQSPPHAMALRRTHHSSTSTAEFVPPRSPCGRRRARARCGPPGAGGRWPSVCDRPCVSGTLSCALRGGTAGREPPPPGLAATARRISRAWARTRSALTPSAGRGDSAGGGLQRAHPAGVNATVRSTPSGRCWQNEVTPPAGVVWVPAA